MAESTVRAYINDLRKEYKIPKIVEQRTYEAVPECLMGSQAQVDFGECWQKSLSGKSIKLTEKNKYSEMSYLISEYLFSLKETFGLAS